MNKESESRIIVLATLQAASLTSALMHMRAGSAKRPLELLEHALDTCVLCLSHLRTEADSVGQKNLVNSLKAIRAYRRGYPRQATTDTHDINMSAIDEIEALARKVIEELEAD